MLNGTTVLSRLLAFRGSYNYAEADGCYALRRVDLA